MENTLMEKTLMEMCTAIVVAQVSHHLLSLEDMTDSLRQVFQTLQDLHQQEHREAVEVPAIRHPQGSIQRNRVVCLECGEAFQLLSTRHLALHGLTPRAYKRKYGIPLTQALSARTLTARRRKLAQEPGMGKELAAWRAERMRQAR